MSKNELKAETLEQTIINHCTGNRNSQLAADATATKSAASLESAMASDQPCGNVSRVLAQWEVARTEIGVFRQIKTRTRENDYCLCLFEEQGAHQSEETDQKITIWVCLANGGPALALEHVCIKDVTFQASARQLRITLQEPASIPSENLSWMSSYKSETRCNDPTRGELHRVRSIDLYLSRLVNSKAVYDLCSKVPAYNRSSFVSPSSSNLRQYSPQMSPLDMLSPVVSEDTAWLSSGGATPDRHFSRSFRTEFHSSDVRPWSDMQKFRNQGDLMAHDNKYRNCVKGQGQSPEKKVAKQSRSGTESEECKAVLQPQTEEGSDAFVSDYRPEGKNYSYYRHQHSHLVRKLQQQVHCQPQSRSRSQTFSSPPSDDSLAHADQSPERKETVAGHASAIQQCRTILAHARVESDPGSACLPHGRRCISTSEAETATSSVGTNGATVERVDVSKDHRRLGCDDRLETSQSSEKTPLTGVDKVGSKETDAQYRSKRISLTISTDFPKESLFDTSMSCVSDSSSDRRASISSSISDTSDDLTHSTISCSSSSSSLCSSIIPRKGGPPVHYTLTCWIGGRWPCKLRPLIKKSTLNDIHATLRRNLRLPRSYYIDIEFEWQGTTYMILDATHWQWAREQVNHGDMNIRCRMWQKRYIR